MTATQRERHDHIILRPRQRWVSCKTLFKSATATPTSLGVGDWVRSNPIAAVMVLVRLAPRGRRGNNAFGKRSRAKASQHSARAAKEPWLLVASPKRAALPAKQSSVRCRRHGLQHGFREIRLRRPARPPRARPLPRLHAPGRYPRGLEARPPRPLPPSSSSSRPWNP
jgi:hypothetical protein